ncbi:hypothetical protein SAMD00019534_019680 [Acytostelium subglobosum LB1]|uniref:hypothetical protein n=1 Tax=Acytostelium subglobosum LB1 TaxID=1410327 RepID=UPI0006449E28|nr:hypothetical protein SAMD00019534_019680 [Acytostelium subglobosum LB1]GAM18793.1 hypothetical protein SAMD00019534_019680 [Acytostelium subglobosum LB1]|eukprot:XP_012758013.1 hypothetical protein SAMD00019534_019680 [Acytostelium subglobosum LB1]
MELEIFDDDLDAEGMMKILVIGGVNNGKTSIISKACYNNMESEKTINTIGVGFHTKKIQMDSKQIRMCFWDFSGQDRFLCLTRCYFNEANAAIVVTDASRPNSLELALNWKRELDNNFEYKIPTFLFANKYDLIKDEPTYTEQQLNQITRDNGFDKWAYTSAKDGHGIEDAIEELVRQTMKESYHHVRRLRHASMRDSFKLSSGSPIMPPTVLLGAGGGGHGVASEKCQLPKEKKRCCS